MCVKNNHVEWHLVDLIENVAEESVIHRVYPGSEKCIHATPRKSLLTIAVFLSIW